MLMPGLDERAPLVGRVDELDRLAGLVGLTSDEPLPESAVLLAGDAGVGKTRLLAELRSRAEKAGYRVLVGHCLDFGDSALPYLPFSEAFGRLAAETPTQAKSLVEAAPAVARLMPARRVIPEQAGGSAAAEADHLDRPDLFAAVHSALELIGRAAPLLLLVEDVHWADRSTREMLSYLFSRRFDAPVAIVASYRTDDLHRRHPLRTTAAEWSRLPGVTRLELGRLADDDVRALVEELHPAPLPDRAVRGIVRRAEGNAFFTEELVQAAELGPDSIPEALADLLLVRLDQLDDDARLVVRAAAVSGRRVPHLLLDRVVDGQVGSLDLSLRAAVERNVLVPRGDAYGFRHALLAEAVYDDLLPGERVRLHAAYAHALQQGGVGGTAAELARHARAANDLPTAARASIAAGDEAMAVAGPDEAAHHYELALELAPQVGLDETALVELTAKACEAALAAGQTYRALALARDQLRATSPDASPHARLRMLRVKASIALVADTEGDALMNTTEALALLEKYPDEQVRAEVARPARPGAGRGAPAGRGRRSRQRRAGARRLAGAGRLAADARTTLARLRERSGETAASKAMLQKTIGQARAAGDLAAELRGVFNLGTLQYESGDVAGARESYAVAERRARSAGRPWAPYGLESRVLGIQAAYTAGDWDAAAAMADLSHDAPPDLGEAMVRASAMCVAPDAATSRLSTCCRRLLRTPRARAWWRCSPASRPSTSTATAVTCRPCSRRTTTSSPRSGRCGPTRTSRPGSGCPRWCSATSRPRPGAPAARTATSWWRGPTSSCEAARRAVRLREQSVWDEGPEALAWLARVDAEHARVRWLAGSGETELDELVAAWRLAVERFDAYGHVFETARSRSRLAAVLRAGGHPAEADEVAALAVAQARRLGAEPLLRELRAGGAPGRAGRPDAGVPARRGTHGARAGGARAGRAGPQQPRDRRAAVHQRQDRERARVEHPGQARRRRAHRGGRDRPPPGLPRRLTAALPRLPGALHHVAEVEPGGPAELGAILEASAKYAAGSPARRPTTCTSKSSPVTSRTVRNTSLTVTPSPRPTLKTSPSGPSSSRGPPPRAPRPGRPRGCSRGRRSRRGCRVVVAEELRVAALGSAWKIIGTRLFTPRSASSGAPAPATLK